MSKTGEISVYPLKMSDGTDNAILGDKPEKPPTAEQLKAACDGVAPPGFRFEKPVTAKENP